MCSLLTKFLKAINQEMGAHSCSKQSTPTLRLEVHALPGSKEFIPPVPLQLLTSFSLKVNLECR